MPEQELNKEIPDVEAEVKIFDFQDFAKERSNVQPVEDKKVEVKDVKSEAELDDEVEKPEAVEEPKQPRIKKQDVKGLPVDGIDDEMERMEVPKEVVKKEVLPEERDYSIFDPADAPKFKRMNNEAFKRLSEIYLENKELKNKPPVEVKQGELPPNYLSHPKAYLLDPNYEKVAGEYTTAQAIADHWKQQELNIKHDGKWQDLDMDKNGNLILGEFKEADKASELAVSKQVDFARNQLSKSMSKYEKFIGDFDSKVKGDNEFIKNVELKFFPGYEKPDHPTSKYQQDIINALPPSQRDLPVTKLLAKTGAALNLLNVEYQKVKAELDKIKGIKQDANQAPPPKRNFVNGSSNGHQSVTMDDFRKERASRF